MLASICIGGWHAVSASSRYAVLNPSQAVVVLLLLLLPGISDIDRFDSFSDTYFSSGWSSICTVHTKHQPGCSDIYARWLWSFLRQFLMKNWRSPEDSRSFCVLMLMPSIVCSKYGFNTAYVKTCSPCNINVRFTQPCWLAVPEPGDIAFTMRLHLISVYRVCQAITVRNYSCTQHHVGLHL